jgi:hypothetical protein
MAAAPPEKQGPLIQQQRNFMSQTRTFLAGATTMAAALAAIVTLTGAKSPLRHETFDEITVGRINIVEPDGTKRLIIANKAQFPGLFKQGKEIARPDRRDFAGMLFINEEGTENGGLIQKGSIGADGKISSGLSLTFDRFRQDQAMQLINTDSANYQRTGMSINDIPYYKDEGGQMQNRIWLGNTGDKGSSLQLKDAKGRTRMMLLVSADGKAEIQMLDEQGKVSKSITPGT